MSNDKRRIQIAAPEVRYGESQLETYVIYLKNFLCNLGPLGLCLLCYSPIHLVTMTLQKILYLLIRLQLLSRVLSIRPSN